MREPSAIDQISPSAFLGSRCFLLKQHVASMVVLLNQPEEAQGKQVGQSNQLLKEGVEI